MTLPQRDRTGRGRGRRQFSEVERDVLDAAGMLLLDVGIKGFTVERVSQLSGVSKATIYKHWPSVGSLALAGYRNAVRDELGIRDSGDLSSDLVLVLSRFVHLMRDTNAGAAFAQLIGQAQSDDRLSAAFVEQYYLPRRRDVLVLLLGARERGAIREDVNLEITVDLLIGAAYERLLMRSSEYALDEAYVERVVETVLAGIAPRHP